jgi:hypothetical protein
LLHGVLQAEQQPDAGSGSVSALSRSGTVNGFFANMHRGRARTTAAEPLKPDRFQSFSPQPPRQIRPIGASISALVMKMKRFRPEKATPLIT